jgi:hypothetical protein
MTAFIEEAPIHIPADAWAFLAGRPSPQEAADLEVKVHEYLANGGAITEVPVGATADATSDIGAHAYTITATSKFGLEQRRKHTAKARGAKLRRDQHLAARIRAHLPAENRAWLAKTLGVSDGLVCRIIKGYLADVPAAVALLKRRFDDTPQLNQVKAELAKGTIGVGNICANAGISSSTLYALERKHGFKVPRTRTRKGARKVG